MYSKQFNAKFTWLPYRKLIIAVILHYLMCASLLNAQQSPLPAGTTAGTTGGSAIPGVTTGGNGAGQNQSPLPGSNPPGSQMCGINTGENCATDSDVGSTFDNLSPSSQIGNPVSLITGNKYQFESDYQNSATKLQFNRHYNSHNSDFNTGFGQGWTISYSTKLYNVPEEGYDILQSTGQRIHFREKDVNDIGDKIVKATNPAMGYIYEKNERHFWVVPDGRVLTFQGSFLIKIDFRGNHHLLLHYKNQRLSEIKDEAGRLLLLEYHASKTGLSEYSGSNHQNQPNHLSKVTLPDGRFIEYDYDRNRNLSRVRYSDGLHKIFHYENEVFTNHITGITDRTGVRYATWTYNANGKVASSEHANGVERVELEYLPPDNERDLGVTTVINSLGQSSRYTWQMFGLSGQALLLSAEGPGCSTCPVKDMRYSYNDRYQLEISSSVHGEQTRYVYDDLNRLSDVYRTKTSGIEIHLTHREYKGVSSLISFFSKPSVNPNARHGFTVEYDPNNQVSKITETGFAPTGLDESSFAPIERTVTLSYLNGRLSKIDKTRTDVEDITHYDYDPLGRLEKVYLPTGEIITLGDFDSQGRATKVQHGELSPIRIHYGINGKIEKMTLRDGTVSYQYDAEDRLIGLVDPNGKSATLNYDDAGRLSETIDDMGLVTKYVKDTEGRLQQQSSYGLNSELLYSVSYAYTELGQLQSTIEQQRSGSTDQLVERKIERTYDDIGRLISQRNSRDEAVVQFSYDNHSRIKSLMQNSVLLGSVDYDNKYQKIGFTDARGNQTRLLKDDFGRVVVANQPDAGSRIYTYDPAGNVTKIQYSNGAEFSYEYDAGNRLIREQKPDGLTLFKFHPSNGQLVETSNAYSSEQRKYNQELQLTEHIRNIDGHSFVTRYDYNINGFLSVKQLPDGQTLRYHYHDSGVNAGSLQAITRESLFGIIQETLVKDIDSDSRDGKTGFVSHNEIQTTTEYLPNGSIDSISAGGLLSLKYTYDDDGMIVGIRQNEHQQNYDYTSGQLTDAKTVLGEFKYQYDGVSNRINAIEHLNNGVQTDLSYQYGIGNRLLSTSDNLTGLLNEYGYNDRGSVANAGSADATNTSGIMYEYSSDQRPVRMYRGNVLIAEYTYNSFGERIKKIVHLDNSSNATYYLYDDRQMSAEISAGGVVDTQYIYLFDKTPVAKLEKDKVYAVHSDHLGTPKRMTDDGGQLVWASEHTPFGKAEVKLETVTMNLRFPGQYADSETNTHYNYLRNYDPGLGRYITSDPIGLRGGVNSYAYVNSNPVSNSDPLGLYCVNNNGELTCEYPNGPKFTITLPDYNQGFPSFSDAQWLLHHDYDIARRVHPFTVFGCITPERAMQAIIDRPVPGPVYSPATPEGTRNNADVFIAPNNMVTSYLTTDLNSGNPVVVNLADPDSAFYPGYVIRTVIDGVAHNYGEGLDPLQSVDFATNIPNNFIWGGLTADTIRAERSYCSCFD